MAISSEHEIELLRNAVAGDQDALQRLLLHTYGTIEVAVRSRFSEKLAGHMQVEDLVQEIIVKVYRSIGRYHDIENREFQLLGR